MNIDVADGRHFGQARLARVFDDILTPAFPADELVPRAELFADLASGDSACWVAVVEGNDLGVAIVDHQPACGTSLLSYLAVKQSSRARGLGSTLMRRVLETRTGLLVVEVEDPRLHRDQGFGEPDRRAGFYARHGAQVLAVPFFQPALSPTGSRVPGMLLAVLGEPTAAEVPAAPLRCFVQSYFGGYDDPLDDPDGMALRASLAGDSVRLLPMPTA